MFSLLAMMVIDTAFRKSSLGKLFLEKIVPGTSLRIGHIIQTCQFSVLNLNFHLPNVNKARDS